MVTVQRDKLNLGVRSAESVRFSYDNRAFTPEKQPANQLGTMGALVASSSLESRHGESLSRHTSDSAGSPCRPGVPSIALAPVHLSAGGKFKTTPGPLQRVTSIANGNAQVLRIKPFHKEVSRLKSRMRTEFVCALIRNLLCAVFLGSIAITTIEEHHIPDWIVNRKIPALIFLLCGLVGIVIQVVHVTSLIRGGTPTILSTMLRLSKSRDHFMGVMHERRTAPPFMAVEVMLRANEEKSSFSKHQTHWVHLARETLKSLVYNSWYDQSIQIDAAMKYKSCWLILAKDYTSDTIITRKSFEEDINSFKEFTGFHKYLARMKLKFVLDVQKGEFFPDAEPHYVYGEDPPTFQSIQMYTVASILAMDALYHVLFFLFTKNAGVCRLVKCMSRNQQTRSTLHSASIDNNNNNKKEDYAEDIKVLSV